jgi:site-specific DNA-methyltransferase (adenine-specific)
MDVNTIYNENCLDTMARMPDGFVDLTVTSPPYDNLRTYNGYEFDFEPIARELFRVTKKGGVVVWVVGDATINGSETGTSFRQALYFKEIGFNLHDTMIYHKNALTFPETNRYYPSFEYMFVLSKDKPCTVNQIADKKNIHFGDIMTGKQREADGSLKRRSGQGRPIKEFSVRQNVWTYSTGWMVSSPDAETFQHGAAFAEPLARDHILSWSNEGDLVYDPFMGSGTTAKAAHQLKRRWIGSEISSEYVELANKRLKPYLAQGTLF